MANIKVTAGIYGITFSLSPTHKYVIAWWQIEQDGVTKWHDHLREKAWFTDDVSLRFTDLCFKHYNWT